jgi:glycosyltransferase involved in cell wall biosynthesis
MKQDTLDFEVPIINQEKQDAEEFLKTHKVAIFVVAYEAEKYIESLIKRIPSNLLPHFAEIFIFDDHSSDKTYEIARDVKTKLNLKNLNVFRTPYNRGYGGNQKLGYLYAITKGYDVVILLHGDAQYPPEYLPRIIAPFKDDRVDAVFASRMITKKSALAGGMPPYKWIGNQILTKFENSILGTKLSEFHTGYRAFRTRILKRIPFKYNDNGFHFDTEIIIQVTGSGGLIKEVPIPTHYGDEICHVNGISYAFNCMRSVLWYRLTKYGIYFDRRFDIDLFEKSDVTYKKAPNTVHQYMINRRWKPGRRVVQLCAGSGRISAQIAAKGCKVIAVDNPAPPFPGNAESVETDLTQPFDEILGHRKYHTVLLLDGLEHYNAVGDICERISNLLKPGGHLYICTGNVAYFPVRLILLLGEFHYGKRGILDVSHTRLFTKRALARLLRNSGFEIRKVRGFGPPLRDMISNRPITKLLDSFLGFIARIRPSFFGYQILFIAEKLDDVETILEQTINNSEE